MRTKKPQHNLILFIDSSILGVSVSFCHLEQEQHTLWQGVCSDVGMSAKEQSVLVLNGLKHLQKNFSDIKGIVVSTGPGSFTGIRVGLSFVYGLVASCSKQDTSDTNPKILGLSSLGSAATDIFRESLRDVKKMSLFLPATKTAGYVALVERASHNDDTFHCVLKPFSIPVSQVSQAPNAFSERATLNITAPWPELQVEFAKMNCTLHVKSLVEIAEHAMTGMIYDARTFWPSKFSADLPQPIFLRKSTVEEKLEPSFV